MVDTTYWLLRCICNSSFAAFSYGLVWREPHESISYGLECPPAGRHARCNLQQIRSNAFVHALDALLRNNRFYGAEDGVVLVAHAGHGIDLESSS